jgi:dsDNA-specific endonuclease/ATPase MutS2
MQAILERLLDEGNARLVVTTHYGQLKALATVDPRFAVAAMQVCFLLLASACISMRQHASAYVTIL